jgi:hypothetical protein
VINRTFSLYRSNPKLVIRLEKLNSQILNSNWENNVSLMLDVPFYELEMKRLENKILKSSLFSQDVYDAANKVSRTFDVFYICEDVRDHINELIEVLWRSTGIMGAGAFAGPTIANLDDNTKALNESYENLLEKYPDVCCFTIFKLFQFKPKIEESVGHALSLLRSAHKFRFKDEHFFNY